MRWLRLVCSLKLQVSFAKEPYKRDYIPQKKPLILRSLLIVATPYSSPLLPEAWLEKDKCIQTYIYFYTNLFIQTHMYINSCVCKCIQTYIYIYDTHVCICIYIYMNLYICTYIYTHTWMYVCFVAIFENQSKQPELELGYISIYTYI